MFELIPYQQLVITLGSILALPLVLGFILQKLIDRENKLDTQKYPNRIKQFNRREYVNTSNNRYSNTNTNY